MELMVVTLVSFPGVTVGHGKTSFPWNIVQYPQVLGGIEFSTFPPNSPSSSTGYRLRSSSAGPIMNNKASCPGEQETLSVRTTDQRLLMCLSNSWCKAMPRRFLAMMIPFGSTKKLMGIEFTP